MRIKSIKLNNFRNYETFSFEFSKEGCIIVGKNGIGKTNLLEAITYFAYGKSILNSRDNELVRFNEKFFRISALFENHQVDNSFAISYQNVKSIKVNDMWVKKISELYQYLQIIYFSPDDINIIINTPKNRRSFLDLSIYKVFWGYIEIMKMYQNVLVQRNALFKTDYHKAEKNAWDEQLASMGAEIIDYRLKFLERFAPIFQKTYETISGNSEKIEIEYISQFKFDHKHIKRDFLNELKKKEDREKFLQRTIVGPHLDDLLIKINGNPVIMYASQGQKRSIVIALKIALAEMIYKSTSSFPILLFDDTLAELDKDRSRNLIELLAKNHQIFIATPNKEHYTHFNLPILNLEELIDENKNKVMQDTQIETLEKELENGGFEEEPQMPEAE
ncbi:MAG TPA: DNA replication/repair protein RecF [Candidatus Cloacimonadota bacterium]|nr:DNA replication/repair protein RecF [Candidatus Cloacimonadota bacterium]